MGRTLINYKEMEINKNMYFTELNSEEIDEINGGFLGTISGFIVKDFIKSLRKVEVAPNVNDLLGFSQLLKIINVSLASL